VNFFVVKPTRCTIFRVDWISLYMFQTVFLSIIRSPRLYIQHWLFASRPEMEFHLGPTSKQSTNLYHIYLTLYVQSRTPDYGWKDCPKHVEWYSINLKNCASSWFYYRNISQCMVPWTSKITCEVESLSTNCRECRSQVQITSSKLQFMFLHILNNRNQHLSRWLLSLGTEILQFSR
jgi:hypothetical protein